MNMNIRVRNEDYIRNDDRFLEYKSFLLYLGENILNLLVRDACTLDGDYNKPDLVENLRREDVAGLCNAAADLAKSYIKDYAPKLIGEYPKVDVKTIHGELSHTPRIPTHEWASQHTMSRVKIGNYVFYLDVTGYQFSDLFKVDPIIVTTEIPWWFYPDRKNPSFSKKGAWLNYHFGIKVKLAGVKVRLGIIEFFQYFVWGKIATLLRKIAIKILVKDERRK